MVRSHIQLVVTVGVQPPSTVADPLRGVRRWVPYFRAAALVQRRELWFQNRWLLVVWMTEV